MTGFAWREEELAKVDQLVPYNAEKLAKERGGLYEKATLPFVPYAVVDGNLVTGQNPASAKKPAGERWRESGDGNPGVGPTRSDGPDRDPAPGAGAGAGGG